MWKTLKSVLPSKQSQISDPSLTAANFNSYFSSIGNRLTENIPLCSITDNDKCSNQHFKFNVISVLFITKCLATLKYNSSLDVIDMDGRLLKLAAKLLALSITYIFNLSLQRGVIPDDLKLARINPIFKGKGDISNMSNYRPISVISYLGKILEKSVKHQLVQYLNRFGFITNYQMAYMKERSTQMVINFISNNVLNNINNGLYTCTCLIDLSKCFDCVHHEILLNKLNKYGINDRELAWFRSYLNNRKQVVSYNNISSSACNINIGVPQGTVLGPMLFLIYMNELPNILPKDHCIMYADDNTLFSSSKNFSEANTKLQNIVSKTVDWIDKNRFNHK